jgi:hypothetical protein
MHRPITYRLINDNVAVADLDVIQAIWVGADPCLELNRSALAPEIRQRHQITRTTLATSRKSKLHARYPFLQFRHTLTHTQRRLAKLPPRCPSRGNGNTHIPTVPYHAASLLWQVEQPSHVRCGSSLKMRDSSNFGASTHARRCCPAQQPPQPPQPPGDRLPSLRSQARLRDAWQSPLALPPYAIRVFVAFGICRPFEYSCEGKPQRFHKMST